MICRRCGVDHEGLIHTMRPADTSLSTGLLDFVATLPPGFVMAEIGCYAGESTTIFLTRAGHITAIDPWEDYDEDNRPYGELEHICDSHLVEAAFDKVVDEAHGRITKIKGRSTEIAQTFADGTFDVVYIDANHEYPHVLTDVTAWKPKVKPGGILAGHDYDGSHLGVTRAIEEVLLGPPHAIFPDSTWAHRIGPGPHADGPRLLPSDGAPQVLIGIPCHMAGGFRPFEIALQRLMEGRHNTHVFYSMTGVLPGARNRIVREAYRIGAEYIWFLDDDQPFFSGDPTRPSDLDALLAHKLDAVIPLSCRRGAPFLPLLYDFIHNDGWIASQHYLLPEDYGLVPVAASGFAGLLIKTDVFTRMGKDGWFEFTHPPDDFDNYSEDFPFYRKLEKAGVQLYCDLEVRFGHAIQCVAWIVRQDGKWVTALADHEPFVMFPQPMHPLGIETVRKQRPSKRLVLA